MAPANAVVLNPFEKIETPTVDLDPSVPSLTLVDIDKLIAKKKIRNVDFLSADKALANLADGSKAYITLDQAETLLARLRDARIPYTYSAYNLDAFTKPTPRDPATISPGAQYSAALLADLDDSR